MERAGVLSFLFGGVSELVESIWQFITSSVNADQWTTLPHLWEYVSYLFGNSSVAADFTRVLLTLLILYIILAIKRAIFS